ncbi:TPA: PAS domain S-box protein [Methanosarcina acetivorans]|nr:PAS domain S-box protein [Methanosarcina acetivorans]HIH95146.1 PAS domain S-box protein [Methanosarcina acetivorans]
MNAKVEQTPATNQNLVLSVDNNGTIIHSNEASEPILKEWGVSVGEKLPSSIVDLVQRVISRNSPEKTEVKVGNKLYLVVFSPLPEEQRVSISGFDISDQKEFEKGMVSETREKAERDTLVEELRKSEKKYRTLFDTIDEGFCVIEVLFDEADCPIDYRFLEINASFERQTGIKNAVGRRMREIAPEHEEHWFQIYGNVALTGEPVRFENPAIALGHFYDVYAFRTGDPDHRRVGILFNDIAKRKRAEEMLRESAERQAFLLQLSDALRPLFDPIEIQAVATRVLGEHLGIARVAYGEVTDDDTFIVFERNYVAPGVPLVTGRFRMADFGPSLLSALKEGRTIVVPDLASSTELSEAERSGYANLGIASLMGVPLVKGGRFVAELVVHHTAPRQWSPAEVALIEETAERTWAAVERAKAEEALKESEERFRTLSETSPIGVGVSSAESKIIYTNPAYDRILGYNPSELIGRNSTDVYWNPEERKSWCRTLKDKGVVRDFETKFKKKDGTPVWVSINTSPISFGGRKAAMGTIQDISERKQAEEALRESELKFRTLSNTLEEKVKERTVELEKAYKFLQEIDIIRKQEIHHRIKNNLQVISSLLDLQAEKFRGKKNIEDSKILEAFKESQDRVISMALIHEELHKSGEIDTLNFSAYIHELSGNLFLSYRLGNDGISLDMDIEEDIFFDMDTSVPLGMIVNELVSNSLKHAFSDRDKGEIRIKLHRKKNRESDIEDCCIAFILSVSDNGIGIPKDLEIEDIESLGLQLVTTLIDQLDGELELKRDDGTEFIVRFSITERDNQANSPTQQFNEF